MISLKLSRKQIKILIIVFLAIILIVMVVFLLTKNKKSQISQPKPLETLEEIERKVPTIENKFVAQQATQESIASTVARNFAERLGSYSSDNKQENFQSLSSLMSDDFKSNFKNTTALEKLNTTEYYGISSKALKIDTTISESGDRANSSVYLQRIENINNQESIIEGKLDLDLIKSGDRWLVDSAKWE